ncbi:hypothetical protein A2662_04240 [Candidatus Giovannonibacteria bacterium RIFCSPHIGHO2_01_FULL_45_33]|uniref:Transposase IS200-like domain-containing protein n=1 Tax=Candidatus Giovannonibacteria bacterium RIFCSPLOWO2_01_FULL_45_34 TaxID=1798351 RepID=A0A1F5WZ78_9BACT|nr:MAG: hypothetical protein A2662_04240 [Candidatus Giovannonibacteria bacterium RIFCSPHIGHO2_01_FULL_45_33]OGF69440.1 MAG: hypothetical protein A3C73_03855 [Candidatus Giovannonibacteria bacterium RIFCSPHIGHO2_02_FULL_44_11]OGF80940.1 MAG: hypothetical protein A2930_02545 [Candidatus Giovannonibacteria bacterium RIFCSPLOWO2_01_FULL_45_34]
MRKLKFVKGEFYHIYNRGVDKRNIFNNEYDVKRFLQSMDEFNTVKPIGSLFENSFVSEEIKSKRRSKQLVNFISYCLNPNHYHFILEESMDGGISRFIHRLSGGYTWYFNQHNKRSGALFQGKFKAKHIDSNEYLLNASIYVNLNYKVHQLGGRAAKLVKSSWEEYIGSNAEISICKEKIILNQFKNKSEYKAFALETMPILIEKKEKEKEFVDLFIED